MADGTLEYIPAEDDENLDEIEDEVSVSGDESDDSIVVPNEHREVDKKFYRHVPEELFHKHDDQLRREMRKNTERRIRSYFSDQCKRFRKHKLHPDKLLNILCHQYSDGYGKLSDKIFDQYMQHLIKAFEKKDTKIPDELVREMAVIFISP